MARDKGTGSVSWSESKQRWIGTIEAGWTSRGTRRRISVTARTKRECIQKLRAKTVEMERTGLAEEGRRQNMTVKVLADEWLTHQETKLEPSGYVTARTAVNQWIIPTIGHRKLAQIQARDVRAVATSIRKAGRTESTISRYHNVLMKMLKDAVRDGHSVTQSALNAEAVTPSKSVRQAIPLNDVTLILEHASQEPDYSRWLAAFYAALRPAEARGLTWDRVDFDMAGWGALEISWQLKALPYRVARDRTSGFRIPVGYEAQQVKHSWHLVRPKTDAGDRWIPLHPTLKKALQLWEPVCPGEYGLVWPNLTGEISRAYGGPREDKPDRAAWKRLCEQAGVPAYELYEARHTAAGFLRDDGVPEETITMIMGHTSIKSTMAYLHATLESAGKYLQSAAGVVVAPDPGVPLLTR